MKIMILVVLCRHHVIFNFRHSVVSVFKRVNTTNISNV